MSTETHSERRLVTAPRSRAGQRALRGAFFSWAKLRRADSLAAALGFPSHTVRYLRRGGPALLTLWRYFLQASRTLWLLLRERPQVVLVTNPPVFAVLPVWLYAVIFRARYVIDFHSGAFLDPHWVRWKRLQRFLGRRAAVNLVHNGDNARVAEEWGLPFIVFPSPPPELQPAPPPPVRERPVAVYVCSFKSDEPVDVFLEAARRLPGIDFRVTGRPPAGLAGTLPPNILLTGFLSEEAYNELLSGADLMIVLTTRPGTLLYGAQEAIALHKPLVLSKTPTLEAYFEGGTVFAENTPEGLEGAIRSATGRAAELRRLMGDFERRARVEGARRIQELQGRLGI